MNIRHRHIFWTAVILVAVVSVVAVASTYRLQQQYSASTRSQQAILELDRFLSDLKDVEAGARGYAITRDPRFLEPYRDGRVNVRRRLGRIRRLSIHEPELLKGFAGLALAVDRRLSAADLLIDRVGTGAGQSEVASAASVGKSAMDEVRGQIATMVDARQGVYLRQRSLLERQAAIASLALGIGVAASLLVLIWLFGRLNREVVRRREAEDDLRSLNAGLELRVGQRTAEVEESRQLLTAIIESMPDTVFLKDAGDDFRYVMINEAGEKLLGRSRSDLLGHVDHELFPTSEAALCRKEDQRIAETPSLRLVSERSLTTGTGERLVETRKSPLLLDDGAKKFVLGIARDLTEQKSLELQVRQMQRLESVGRLTGGVAHDFNNLLAVIMGSIELVRERLPAGSETAAIADEALDAAQRGADLVRRLLAFARKQHLEAIAVDLNDRLPDVVPLLQRTLGENIRVQVKSGENLWQARIDPTQVDDALVNLAINARDAMPEGGAVTIETANVVLDEDYALHHVEVEAGEYVMLAVSDAGTGMSPDVIARAFEPFFTTKGEGKGTGLGLSQVYGWVKQSGGHIKIYSELGHGTTVKLYLPRADDDASRTEDPEARELEARGHETIFVVEDNPTVRRTVRRQLADLGYSTIEAEDGEEALRQIGAGVKFDLLLTDVVMPGGMSGYELADQAERIRPGIRVVFTSGYTELAAIGLQGGRSGPLISKPYTKSALGRTIRGALDRGPESAG